MRLDEGESSGEAGRDEERESGLRHIYKAELSGVKEGLVIGSGKPVEGRNKK